MIKIILIWVIVGVASYFFIKLVFKLFLARKLKDLSEKKRIKKLEDFFSDAELKELCRIADENHKKQAEKILIEYYESTLK